MKWSDDFATGVPRVDDQHKMIFKMADDFRDALTEGRGKRTYGDFIQFLGVYISTHFAFEAACMHRFHCPVAKLNDDAHARFTQTFTGFRQRFETQGFVHEDALLLVETIDAWLANHIARIDTRLKDSVGTPDSTL